MKAIPDIWRPIEGELRAFLRVAPQLIAEGKGGQYLLLRDGQPVNTWPTYRDASRYGHQTYDDGRFVIQPLDPKSVSELSEWFDPVDSLRAGAA